MIRKLNRNGIKIIYTMIFLISIFLIIKGYISYKNIAREENLKQIEEVVKFIKELESKDVIEVENKINSIDEIKDVKDKDFKKVFENYVIMGDSRAEVLVEYEILNKSSVIAYKGRNTDIAMKDIDILENLHPRKIFMNYGMNDMEYFGGDANSFVQHYEKLIEDIKIKYPKSKIYISDILPVQQKAIDKKSVYSKVEEFNDSLKEMCNRLGLNFIETRNIVIENPKFYEPDGIHLIQDFYPLWLKELSDKSS